MERHVRVGVIGTSWWAEAMHLPSLASHPRAEIAALCGRGQERARALADRFGVPRVFDDYRRMLADAELDALVIVAPDDLHYPMALAGLERGLHVLCEKPLALTLAQAKTLAARAQAAGVVTMMGFSWRELPHYRYLRQLVRSGYLGRCYGASFSYLSGGGARGAYSWRYDARRSNGTLGNYGAHMIDLARWLLGEIVAVSAQLSQTVTRPGPAGQPAPLAHDQATLMLSFASGTPGTVHVSEVAHTAERLHEQQVRLYGEHGTLEADLSLAGSDLRAGRVALAATIRGARRGDTRFQTLPVPGELLGGADPASLFAPFVSQPIGGRRFIDAIIGGRQAGPDFRDGVAVQAVMEAAVAAHRRQRRVPVGAAADAVTLSLSQRRSYLPERAP